METNSTADSAPSSLADRLAAARHGRFVGREAEIALFRSILLAEQASVVVLHIYGPGGVGKTTLLHEYERMVEQVGRTAVLLDSRNLEATPAGFQHGWQEALASLGETAVPPNLVLLVDTYELLEAIDDWLRHDFLPQLPPNVLIIFAGRNAPASGWRTEPGWSALTRIIPLRNLRPEESQTYLTVRGVSPQQHADVLAFTHGHPLALSLVADVLQQGDEQLTLNPHNDPNIVRVLLERFTRNIPDTQHRQALEICAHVRVTSESLLAVLMGDVNDHELFAWLRSLSFIQQGTQGLFPHDLARDVLDADFRWRNPEAYQLMHRQIRLHYGQQLRQMGHQSTLSADLIYQNRYITAANPFFNWEALSQVTMEPATTADHPFILQAVARHEGVASAEIARYWLQKQPEAFAVFRTAQDRMAFVASLMLPIITDADAQADPACAVARAFVQGHGLPPQPDEPINYVRFWMGREHYQVAETQSLVAMRAGGGWISNPHMSWTFAATAVPQNWLDLFTQFNFDYTGTADFIVDGHQYGVFTHDWRVESVAAWGYRLENIQLGLQPGQKRDEAISPPSPPPLLTLSQPEFIEAVRQALRDYTRPDLLAQNPLMRSRLVVETGVIEVATLQKLLRTAADSLMGNPKDLKFHAAVFRTYLKPAPSQELAAELLNLPLGTYRYRLAKGVERIADWLWRRELQA